MILRDYFDQNIAFNVVDVFIKLKMNFKEDISNIKGITRN